MRARCSRGGCGPRCPLRRQPEFLQHLAVELEGDGRRTVDEAHPHRVVEIIPVGVLVVALAGGQLVLPEAAVLDVALQLIGVGRGRGRAGCRRRASRPGCRSRACARDARDNRCNLLGTLGSHLGRPCLASPAARPDRAARPGTAGRRDRARAPAGGSHRPGPPASRSAGPAARCSPSARGRWCPAGSGRHRRPSPRSRHRHR